MTVLRCLILDDNKDHRRIFKSVIELAWQSLAPGAPIECVVVSLPGEALDALARASFTVFLADILFKNDEAWGVTCIEQARSRHQDLVILGMTGGAGRRPDLKEKAMAAGANEFIDKIALLAGDAIPLLATVLKTHLKSAHPHLLPQFQISWDGNHLPLSALVEYIGRDELSELASKILPDAAVEASIGFVRSGLSGAVVLRLEGRDSHGVLPPLLIKMARDRELIQRELTARALTDQFPQNAFVAFGVTNAGRLFEADGWYAIGSRFAVGATTALEWVVGERKRPRPAETVVRDLLTTKLVMQYWTDDTATADARLFESLVATRRGRIWLALEQLSTVASRHSGTLEFDPRRVDEFLRSGQLGSGQLSVGCKMRLSHGDLHSRNVLVSEGGEPSLVDPANIRELHWAADVARFLVDMVVSGLDSDVSGMTTHYDWEQFPQWVGLATSWLDGRMSAYVPNDADGTGNSRIGSVIRDVEGSLNSVFSGVWSRENDWEYRLAIALEFLRTSYRETDLPTPKRVFGLLAGCYGLSVAAEGRQRAIR